MWLGAALLFEEDASLNTNDARETESEDGEQGMDPDAEDVEAEEVEVDEAEAEAEAGYGQMIDACSCRGVRCAGGSVSGKAVMYSSGWRGEEGM